MRAADQERHPFGERRIELPGPQQVCMSIDREDGVERRARR